MHTSVAELNELHELRGNIRRSVDALELCWSCQRVSECAQKVVDDAAPVWLCRECRSARCAPEQAEFATLLWPSPR